MAPEVPSYLNFRQNLLAISREKRDFLVLEEHQDFAKKAQGHQNLQVYSLQGEVLRKAYALVDNTVSDFGQDVYLASLQEYQKSVEAFNAAVAPNVKKVRFAK